MKSDNLGGRSGVSSFSSGINPPAGWIQITALSANVGNLNPFARRKYNNKLFRLDVEKKLKKNILELRPDIVFMQELLHPDQCKNWKEKNKSNSCSSDVVIEEENQARRLLGNQYSLACFSRYRQSVGHPVGLECIAIHKEAGYFDGIGKGGIGMNIGRMDKIIGKCNPEFVVSSISAFVHGHKVTLVNAHPNSANLQCKIESIKQIFLGNSSQLPLTGIGNCMIAGDFNFDPFRENNSISEIWNEFVGLPGSGKPFHYHSGIAEHDPPFYTVKNILGKKTVDHVISNWAIGTSKTLGETPGTTRLDSGKGTDHRAIFSELWVSPK